ncbi:MAG: TorF family putative porin [Parvularculaceae bacterium]
MRRQIPRLSAAFCSVAAFAGPAYAEGVSVTTTFAFESHYLFRGVQLADTSFQPAATIGYGGFYGTVWLNLPIGDNLLWTTPSTREMDVIAGYSTALSDFVSVDVGVTYYYYPVAADGFFDIYEEDGDGLGANTIEPYVGVAFTAPLSPKVYLFHDVMLDTFTVQGSLTHSFPLGGALSLDPSGIVGYVVDDGAGADYLYGHASLNLTYAFTEEASGYIGARFGGSDIAGGSVFDDLIAGTLDPVGVWFGAGFMANF